MKGRVLKINLGEAKTLKFAIWTILKNYVKLLFTPEYCRRAWIAEYFIDLSLIWCIYKKLWWWSNTLNSLRENLIELEEEVVPYTMHFLEWSIGTFLLWITKKNLLNTSNMTSKIDIFAHQFHLKQTYYIKPWQCKIANGISYQI